ncbi:MAG: HAD hydrolase family protein, partial [Erysipelotrichaceae bacterium]|nr:HAD hydrolase family protein [Erysipelotrichaceae bacterium]
MIKAVFLDFDGTVFSHHSVSIPASTYEAVRLLRNNGIKVFLCTGR